MKRNIHLLALASLVAVHAYGVEEAGADTHLLEARTTNAEVAVILSVTDIRSPEDATNYLCWAETTYPGLRVKGVWETDPIPLAVLAPSMLPLLREGDMAVDPSGRNNFIVDEIGADFVSLRLDRCLGKNEADPHLCLTNVWILPRESLFARWKNLLCTDALAARREIGEFFEVGLAGRNDKSRETWLAETKGFLADNPDARAGIEFRNAAGTSVWVRVNGTADAVAVAPGEKWLWRPDAAAASGKIAWYARGCGSVAHLDDRDEDWIWSTNSVAWKPYGEDLAVDLKPDANSIGKVKNWPIVELPKEVFPQDATNLLQMMTIYYTNPASGEESIQKCQLSYSMKYGKWLGFSLPRLVVKRCEISLEGWEPATYFPTVPYAARPLARGELITLQGAPLKKILLPWGKLRVHVDRNGHEGKIAFFVDASLNEIPDGQDETVVLLADMSRFKTSKAERLPVSVKLHFGGNELKLEEKTVEVVRGVPEVQLSLSIVNATPPPPWPEKIIVGGKTVGTLRIWWQYYCEPALADGVDADEALTQARYFWTGFANGVANKDFPMALAHFEKCRMPGCQFCMPFRDKVKLSGLNQLERRKAFFRALMLNPALNWGSGKKPDVRKVERILDKFSKKPGGKP